jgi:hypothetical protein
MPRLLAAAEEADTHVVQAAVFGIGGAAAGCATTFAPYLQPAVTALLRAIARGDADTAAKGAAAAHGSSRRRARAGGDDDSDDDSDEEGGADTAWDNAVTALGKVIIHQCVLTAPGVAALSPPRSQLLHTFLAHLPLQADFTEAGVAVQMLVD